MRIIWKRAAYLTLLTAGVAVAAVSCTETATSPRSPGATHDTKRTTEKNVDELRAMYGWPGDFHTRALEHAYRQLVTHDARSLSTAAKCRLAEAALKDFTKSYRLKGRPLSVSDVSLAGTPCDEGVKKQIIGWFGRAAVPRSNDMSPDATALLAQVETAADSDGSVESIRSAINAIQNTAAASLGELEAGAVISAGQVAISSVEYWDANLAAWDAGIGGDLPVAYSRATGNPRVGRVVVTMPRAPARSGGDSRAKRIIKADITGFVTHVIYTWWMGPVAWEAAAVRGAAGSLVAAIYPY